jgi:dCTP diphosphatase
MSDKKTLVVDLKHAVQNFVHERNWEKYHNPKDLAEAICVESGELLEIFQWVSSEEASSCKSAPFKLKRIKEELADIFIYCLSMANTMNIDLTQAVLVKLTKDEEKYPVDRFYGKARL